MREEAIYSSEHFNILKRSDGFYIESLKKGGSMQQLNSILGLHPEIAITDFMAIKVAILSPPTNEPVKFGEGKKRYALQVSEDKMKVYLTINVAQQELDKISKDKLAEDIRREMESIGVSFGSKIREVLQSNSFVSQKRILIAEGKEPIHGKDSVSKMININKDKTKVAEDGNVDYFQVNLVTKVNKGDWVGEWTDPEKGRDGMDVYGNLIKATQAKLIPMPYDRASVGEIHENGKTILVALNSGALQIENGKISVSNHMEINGDVDFKTGNINFDGSVTIKGTVKDSFSVVATKDIEILGKEGVGSANKIVSKTGSVIIQGGLNGKNKSVVVAEKDVILKYVSDAEINCKGTLRVAVLVLNSIVAAREVLVEGSSGQIIGGKIEAQTRISCPVAGSNSEIFTHLEVKGVHKQFLEDELVENIKNIDNFKTTGQKLENEISKYAGKKELSNSESREIIELKDKYNTVRRTIKDLEDKKKRLTKDIAVWGDGDVLISRKLFPNVLITIKGKMLKYKQEVLGGHFYYQDGEIKER